MRSGEKILEDFERTRYSSSQIRERLWKEMEEWIYEEDPQWGINVLRILAKEEPDAQERLFRGGRFLERIKSIAKGSQFPPGSRWEALGFLAKYGLREESLRGNLETFDILYEVMLDGEAELRVRAEAGEGLIKLEAGWLMAYLVYPQELRLRLENFAKESKPFPYLSEVKKRWEQSFLSSLSREEEFLASLLLGITTGGALSHFNRLLSVLESSSDRKGELEEKWRSLVLERLWGWRKGPLKKIQEELRLRREISLGQLSLFEVEPLYARSVAKDYYSIGRRDVAGLPAQRAYKPED